CGRGNPESKEESYGRAHAGSLVVCAREFQFMPSQRDWFHTAFDPVKQLDVVNDWPRSTGQLEQTADISACDHIGFRRRDMPELSGTKCAGDPRLQQTVGACRAATKMPLRNIDDIEPGLPQQLLRVDVET